MNTTPMIPLVRPSPPRLSEHIEELRELEVSGVYSNFGPVNSALEAELIRLLFREGHCFAVCNATSGLMLAIREVIGEVRPARRRYALMPSFTFAAAAQAALWCGLTPLLCDIDAQTWLPSRESEERLLVKYAGEIAVIVPYATFGNNLDLERYKRLSQLHDIPIVVDAAASLGSKDILGRSFGAGFPWPVIFSMHATKSFSVGEGGLVYCADRQRLDRLRSMASFGFGEPRNATMLGLNAKLTEIAALTALLQLRRMDSFVEHSAHLSQRYRQQLHQDLQMQRTVGHQVKAFESVLLPTGYAEVRPKVMRQMTEMGVGSAHYFSPHLAEQPYLAQNSMAGPLPVTCDIASRILTLPLHADMSMEQVDWIAKALNEAIANCLPQDLTRKATTSGITSRGTREAEHVSQVLPAA